MARNLKIIDGKIVIPDDYPVLGYAVNFPEPLYEYTNTLSKIMYTNPSNIIRLAILDECVNEKTDAIHPDSILLKNFKTMDMDKPQKKVHIRLSADLVKIMELDAKRLKVSRTVYIKLVTDRFVKKTLYNMKIKVKGIE